MKSIMNIGKQLLAGINKIEFTPRGFLNVMLFCCIAAFTISCSSNAEGYASAYRAQDSTMASTSSVPPQSDVSAVPSTSPSLVLAKKGDTTITTKPLPTFKKELEENAVSAVNNASDEVQRLKARLQELENGRTSDTTSTTSTPVKPKSPAVPIYNCPCMDKHTIQSGTTPSGVVAYYRNKYPKLNINELIRLNKPGFVSDPRKFKAGTVLCLKRKPC